jgi:hypothetical protein
MCGGALRAARIKIPLIREAVVRGGSIYLSDLLPDSTPSEIRDTARGIVVGQSPQPGSIRVLSGDALVRILGEENMLNDVDVPEQILVRRSGRAITRQEVTDAVRTTLRRNEMFAGADVSPESVHFPMHVSVSTANAELRVTRVEMDRSIHMMKFWLISGADPAILPFMVLVRPAGGSSELAAMLGLPSDRNSETVASVQTSAAARRARSRLEDRADDKASGPSNLPSGEPAVRPVMCVEAGKLARLHLVSTTGTQIYLTVTALDRGARGQFVRVKIQTTGKILEARVVDRGQLEAEY